MYTYSLGEGCAHTHILVGPPYGALRGKAFITALLNRDQSLADPATAEPIAVELAGALSSQYPN